VFSQQQQQQHVGSIMNSRRSSGCFEATAANKENQCPLPPPDLSEETLLAPEHNEVLGKLRFISMLVDTIIGRGTLETFFLSFVLYSTLLHLAPLRFHCADGCWDRTQDRCNWCIGSQML
jgi:hypothetical protein